MVLHEYYFDNLTAKPKRPNPRASCAIASKRISAASTSIGKSSSRRSAPWRGVGWAILNEDHRDGRLTNHWISLHEEGNVAGFTPVLVMDVWEHAWLLDYKPAQRPAYVEAFLANVDWNVAAERLSSGCCSV